MGNWSQRIRVAAHSGDQLSKGPRLGQCEGRVEVPAGGRALEDSGDVRAERGRCRGQRRPGGPGGAKTRSRDRLRWGRP